MRLKSFLYLNLFSALAQTDVVVFRYFIIYALDLGLIHAELQGEGFNIHKLEPDSRGVSSVQIALKSGLELQ